MKINSFDTQDFTARCPQIRQAQWVCHKVKSEFPHLSSTKITPSIDKLEDKYPQAADKFMNYNPQAGRFITFDSPEEKRVISILHWFRRFIRNLNAERLSRSAIKDDFGSTYSILSQLKYVRAGNCFENAKLSELILKLNGIDNACVGKIKVGDHNVDHVVCAFNKNGSNFDGDINKNTIIIDSWLGEADFADNMLIKYKSIYKDYLFIPKEGKLSIEKIEKLNLNEAEIQEFKDDFPQLLRKQDY